MRAAADSIKESVKAQNSAPCLHPDVNDGCERPQQVTSTPDNRTPSIPNTPPTFPSSGDGASIGDDANIGDGTKPDLELVATVWYETMCAAIKAAAEKTLPPRKKKSSSVERKVSSRTKQLYKLKRSMQKRSRVSRKDLNHLQKQIQESCLSDFKEWVNNAVVEMEKADAVGNTRKIFNLVKMLSNKPKTPPTNLTHDDAGNLLRSPEDVAKTWENFLSQKFSATQEAR